MKRFNIFEQTHKSFRTLLYETALILQCTDFLDGEETKAAVEKVKEVVQLFDEYSLKEDYVLSTVFEYEPAIVDVFEKEHEQGKYLSKKLISLIELHFIWGIDSHRLSMGRNLNTVFREFMSFSLDHMKREQEVLNKVLWRYFSDEQISQLQEEIGDRTLWHELSVFKLWMQEASSAEAMAN